MPRPGHEHVPQLQVEEAGEHECEAGGGRGAWREWAAREGPCDRVPDLLAWPRPTPGLGTRPTPGPSPVPL